MKIVPFHKLPLKAECWFNGVQCVKVNTRHLMDKNGTLIRVVDTAECRVK